MPNDDRKHHVGQHHDKVRSTANHRGIKLMDDNTQKLSFPVIASRHVGFHHRWGDKAHANMLMGLGVGPDYLEEVAQHQHAMGHTNTAAITHYVANHLHEKRGS
jgi:hypothetical protein